LQAKAKADFQRKPNLANGLDFPPMGPRGALGLYVHRGAGSFRSFIIEPHREDK
jgi:hypothetical protein